MTAISLATGFLTTFTVLPAPATTSPATATDSPSSLVEVPAFAQAWGDFDGDGLEDVFVLSRSGEARLLRNLGTGSFEDATPGSGLEGLVGIRMAEWCEFDADGTPDLFLLRVDGELQLLRGTGSGFFEEVSRELGLAAVTGALDAHWADYDADGWSDLQLTLTDGRPCLLHNLSGRSFERIEPIERDEDPLAGLALVGGVSGASLGGDAKGRGGAAGIGKAGDGKGPASRGRARIAPSSGSVQLEQEPGATELGRSQPGSGGNWDASAPGTIGFQCLDAVKDQATGNCLLASSVPALGMLYPLSNELFVAPNGFVGLGTTSPAHPLHVRTSTSWTVAELESDSQYGTGLLLRNTHPSSTQLWQMRNENSKLWFGFPGTSGNEVALALTTGKRAGIGTDQPGGALHVKAGTANLPVLIAESDNPFGSKLQIKSNAGSGTTWDLLSYTDGSLRMNNDPSSPAIMWLKNKRLGLNCDPQEELHVKASDPTLKLESNQVTGVSGRVSMRQYEGSGFDTYYDASTPGQEEYVLEGFQAGNSLGRYLTIDKADGQVHVNSTVNNALVVEGGVDVVGNSHFGSDLTIAGWTRTGALEILGGADIAEPFDISHDLEVEPGMVVSIDPETIGELRVADRAYDSRVAGVVSGAGGVNAGMTLRQEGSAADGSHLVALTGRVWCWADADAGGAIVAGDLLTTSETPGHAMRVGDPSRAHGAVIGKAMSSLESGRDLVLVLVNLQ